MAKFYCCDMCGKKVSDESDFYDVCISHRGNAVKRKQRGFRYLETCPDCVKAITKCIAALKMRDADTS